MRVFKTKNFAKWAKKEHVTDAILRAGVEEMLQGLIDADLGGGLIKKRIARQGQGKRGGHRSLVALKRDDRAIFIFGFSKNDRENFDEDEKVLYKKLAGYYLNASDEILNLLMRKKELFEVCYEKSG